MAERSDTCSPPDEPRWLWGETAAPAAVADSQRQRPTRAGVIRRVRIVAETGFRITPRWLRLVGACGEARDILGDRTYTVRQAFEVALTVERPDWCDWGTYRLLHILDTHAVCDFAARRARSVQHLWPKSVREACEYAVRYAERAAAGEDAPNDIHLALQAIERFAKPSGFNAWAVDAATWALRTATLGADAAWAAGWTARMAIAAIAEWAGTDAAADEAWLEVADDLQRLLDAQPASILAKSC